MKNLVAACILAISPIAANGMGDEPHDSHQSQAHMQSNLQTYQAAGKVKSISEDRMSLRIFHDPIPELKWPAMNMKFEVADHELVRSLEAGDTVRFEFVQQDGKYMITKILK